MTCSAGLTVRVGFRMGRRGCEIEGKPVGALHHHTAPPVPYPITQPVSAADRPVGEPSARYLVAVQVIHVASSYPLHAGDSAAPFMEEMLAALAARGHQVTVIVPRVKGLVEGMRRGVRVVGTPYAPRRLQHWGYGRSLSQRGRVTLTAAVITPFALLAMGFRLRRAIVEGAPDLIHLHWLVPQGLLAFLVPRNLPVVISVHGADIGFSIGPLRRLAARVLRRASIVVAATSAALEAVGAIGSPRLGFRAIPHGAEESIFTPKDQLEARRVLGVDDRDSVILAVGRLVPKKGFVHLIEAVSSLDPSHTRLYIIGEGPERAILERRIAELRLGQRVHLLGGQPREVVSSWMAAADVVVVPSVATARDIDTGPVVLVEALASGRPVIATRVGMAPDVIEDGVNGFLLDEADPPTLADAIADALRDLTNLKAGAAASFTEIGSWDRVAGQLEEIYLSLVKLR